MGSARYTPIATLLPSVYQEDGESFDQIDSFLGLIDDLHRAYAERIEELSSWLSPAATRFAWPPDVGFDAGADVLLDAYRRLFDELATWTAFEFPDWWTVPMEVGKRRHIVDLNRRSDYLARAARLWRRRHTPRGFVEWVAFAFQIDPVHYPYLVEHFKFGRPGCDHVLEPGPEPWLRATLLVPSTDYFDRAEPRRVLERFVARYAPAHVHLRVCWVPEDFWIYEVDTGGVTERRHLPGPRPRPDDEAGVANWENEVAAYTRHVTCMLCSLVDETPHGLGVRVRNCIDEGEAQDRLGLGRLPTEADE